MIKVQNKKNSNYGQYDGFSTSLLFGEINTGCKDISIQITEVLPTKIQTLHKHPENQCYYIISGKGLMIINDEERNVEDGDAIFIPSNSVHGIKNIGNKILKYLTANKSFGIEKESKIWSLFKDVQNDI